MSANPPIKALSSLASPSSAPAKSSFAQRVVQDQEYWTEHSCHPINQLNVNASGSHVVAVHLIEEILHSDLRGSRSG